MKLENASRAPRDEAGLSPSFGRALSSGDLDAATACFARDGCLITPDATAIHGRERIRPVLGQMILGGTEIRVEWSNAIAAGDVILTQEVWSLVTGRSRGLQVRQSLRPILVLRLIEDTWKLAIAAPWGFRS